MGEATNLIGWVWAFLALLFMIAEMVTAGFVMFCFGIGAAGAAVAAFLGLNLVWQLIIFATLSALAIVLSRPFARRVSNQAENVFGIDRVIGKEAVVIVPIDPKSAQGRVRVEREEWQADSEDGKPIADGETVQVLAVRGTRVLVRPLPGKQTGFRDY